MTPPYGDFAYALTHISAAVRRLRMARISYAGSDLPPAVRMARVAALDAKIDALQAVELDEKAYPWVEDGVLR